MNSVFSQFIWLVMGDFIAPAAGAVFALMLIVYLYRAIKQFGDDAR